MADNAPGFGDTPSFVSEVLMVHAVDPVNSVMQFTFGNFIAELVPRGPPVVMRTFTAVMPLKNVPAGAKLTGAVQGAIEMEPGKGISAMLIFRAGGVSHVFDPLLGPGESTSFTKPINVVVPPGGDLRMTIILALEGSPTDPNAQAFANVSTVDLTIAPPEDIHV